MTSPDILSPLTVPPKALPIRIAQCQHADLESFNSTYFDFLHSVGCNAIYLQNSPFDPMRTGNTGQFFHHFHLISLFDIARSHRRNEYQDYVNEICSRAAKHGLDVWLDCWEPRLPAYAQNLLPVEWRGRGGWGWHESKHIAFCWENPEAVAYWKSLARDAIAALPELDGVIVSMVDNEASLCDASCPRCEGRSMEKGIVDIYSTFSDIAITRPKPLQIALYDWWMPPPLVEKILTKLPKGSLTIGRSARGTPFTAADGSWSGHVQDISNITNSLSEDFPGQCDRSRERGLIPIDMVSWSRGMENFFLPAPPDPLFGIQKSRMLAGVGAGGWIDYDCGCIEEGSLAAGMREWDASPESSDELLLERTLRGIWGEASTSARKAYDLYLEAKRWMPTGIPSKQVPGLDSRCCGLGYCLFGPFHLDDFGFYDTGHARNYFAPFNLLTEDTIPLLSRSASQVTRLLEEACLRLASIATTEPSALWEKADFEIHYRSFRALSNYTRLAAAKWKHGQGELTNPEYQALVKEIASDELENLEAVVSWHAAHPRVLGNPCHRLLGHFSEAWPDADFSGDWLEPKRRSLLFLRDHFDPDEMVPSNFIQGVGTDVCPI